MESFTLDDLRGNLEIAAKRAYLSGATYAQIKYIVSLVAKTGEAPELYKMETLSKKQASSMIDRMINPVSFGTRSKEEIEEASKKADEDRKKLEIAENAFNAKKEAWIAENYPDYNDRSSKSRKRIRHAANKACK